MAMIKNTTPDGTAIIPSAYMLHEVTITNGNGDAVNVQPLVTELSITESIYSPSLICSVSVKDEANIIGAMPFWGLETIKIRISRKEPGDVQSNVDLIFYATDYPLYGRPDKQHVQVWSITGISKEIFRAQHCSYCYPANGQSTSSIIRKLLKSIDIEPEGKFSGGAKFDKEGIVTIKPMMKNLNWLLSRSGNQPVYFYQTLDNKYHLKSHGEINKQVSDLEFTHSRDYNTPPGTEDDYNQRKLRMIQVDSQLNLSKYSPTQDGTWASEINAVDPFNRMIERSYSHKYSPSGTVEKTGVLDSPQSSAEGTPDNNVSTEVSSVSPVQHAFKDLTKFPYAKTHWFPSSNKFSKTGISDAPHAAQKAEAVFNTSDTMVHDVVVFGNFKLNCGLVVTLKFPAAQDPSGTLQWDENLSGKYLATSVTHRFKNQEYYCEFRAKRDSFT